jgi:hypothetical protein
MEEQEARAIVFRLEELTEIRSAVETTRLDYEAKRTEIMRAVQEELAALEVEYTPLLEAAAERVATLEAEIKDDVARHGASVKSRHIQAVYSRGRVSWDSKSLEGYAAAHPDVLAFRKEGAPSISLRALK